MITVPLNKEFTLRSGVYRIGPEIINRRLINRYQCGLFGCDFVCNIYRDWKKHSNGQHKYESELLHLFLEVRIMTREIFNEWQQQYAQKMKFTRKPVAIKPL